MQVHFLSISSSLQSPHSVSFLIHEARLLSLPVIHDILHDIHFFVILLPCHSASLLPANPCLTFNMPCPFNTGSALCHAKRYPCFLSPYAGTLHTTILFLINLYLSFIMLPFSLLVLSTLYIARNITALYLSLGLPISFSSCLCPPTSLPFCPSISLSITPIYYPLVPLFHCFLFPANLPCYLPVMCVSPAPLSQCFPVSLPSYKFCHIVSLSPFLLFLLCLCLICPSVFLSIA